MSVLDPSTPYPWLLYTLAGAAVATRAVPVALDDMTQLQRDLFRAHPAALAVLALICWTLWPLILAVYLWDRVRDGLDWFLFRPWSVRVRRCVNTATAITAGIGLAAGIALVAIGQYWLGGAAILLNLTVLEVNRRLRPAKGADPQS